MAQQDANKNHQAMNSSDHALQISSLKDALKKSRAEYQLCAQAIEELKFLNSHQVRQSICQILSLSDILSQTTKSRKLSSVVCYIKRAAQSLDVFSKNITKVIEQQECGRSVNG